MMRGALLTILLIARTINSNKSNIRVKQSGDGKGNYNFNLSLKVSKFGKRVFKLLNKQILRFISFR